MPRLIIHGCKLSEPQLTGLSFSFTDTAFDISFFSLPISVSARECRYLWTISISILFYRLTEVYRHVCFLETLSIEWEFSITRSLLIVRFCSTNGNYLIFGRWKYCAELEMMGKHVITTRGKY